MAKGCLLPITAERIKKAFKSGDIKLSNLYKMTSKQRVELFQKYVGDEAKMFNANLEKRFLSPNIWE